MSVLTFKKLPITVEDLALGEGIITQQRKSGSLDLTKINLIKIVNSLAEIPSVDVNKYNTILNKRMSSGDEGFFEFYSYNPAGDINIIDGFDYIVSNGNPGYWERFPKRQDFVSTIRNILGSTNYNSYNIPSSYNGNWSLVP